MERDNKYIKTEIYKTTTNQNLQKHKKSKKHLNKLENKEKVEKVSCECGGKYTIKNKMRHCNTKKHLLFLNKGG
jgi:hypothetical protein